MVLADPLAGSPVATAIADASARPGPDAAIYVWGVNASGQLGLGDTADRWEPTVLEALKGKRVIDIAAGSEHSLASTCLSYVYGWGATWTLQLGHHQHTAAQLQPALIAESFDCWVTKVTAGGHHSLFQTLPDDTAVLRGNTGGEGMRLGEEYAMAAITPLLLAASESQQALELARQRHASAAHTPGSKTQAAPSNPPQHGQGAAGAAASTLAGHSAGGAAHAAAAESVTATGTLAASTAVVAAADGMAAIGTGWGGATRCVSAGYGWCAAVCSPSSLDLAVLQALARGEAENVVRMRLLLRAALLPLKRKITVEETLDMVSTAALAKLVDCFSAVWQSCCDIVGALHHAVEHHQPGAIRLARLLENHTSLTVLRQYSVALSNAVALGLTRDATVRRSLYNSLRETGSVGVDTARFRRPATVTSDGNSTDPSDAGAGSASASASTGRDRGAAVNAGSTGSTGNSNANGSSQVLLGASEQDLVEWLLSQPMEQMQLYVDLLGRLSAVLTRTQPEEARALARLGRRWNRLLAAVTQGMATAGETAAFWQLHSALRKSYAIPQRRLVTHSKEVPLSLKGVMASGTWVILFNDALLLASVFSSRLYALSTLWLSAEAPDGRGREGVLRLRFPEDTVTLHTATLRAHTHWLHLLQQTLARLFVRGEHGISTYSMHGLDYRGLLVDDSEESSNGNGSGSSTTGRSSDTLTGSDLARSNLNVRLAPFRYKAHPLYKECTYTGVWRNAAPHGDGSLVCADGRRFMGEFRHGRCHGFATMQAPRELDGIQMATGAWREGKLHGYATVLYHNGDKYVGEWRDGKRHGYGLCTYANGSVYHGEWAGDLCHGYGVVNSSDALWRYLGLWDHGQRQGTGVMVREGVYYEGTFFAGHMHGRGMLVTPTGETRAVGEFGHDGVLQGRGTVWLPDRLVLHGYLTGAWGRGSGVRVNGTLYKLPSAAASPAELTTLDDVTLRLRDADIFSPHTAWATDDDGDRASSQGHSGHVGAVGAGSGQRAFGSGPGSYTGADSAASSGGFSSRGLGEDGHASRGWQDTDVQVKWSGIFARCQAEVSAQ